MEYNKEKKNGPWLSVPQFGQWDQKGVFPDYSMDFSKIRENRKQNKNDLSRASLGNENELIFSTKRDASSVYSAHSNDHHYHQNKSPTRMRRIFRYFNCCSKA
ncbi:hypothetical protein RND71_010878 [Anisodus tanguticus]|uniref:RIN4 pathogenic type III effector avirulence factor Avr cleavage site domain-containing protein n=1 Tax=Anisodus tanguticus TaxID=243964 RepID=A0AAE1SL56_9SOLA|nr:hypothetical protein RND71_010878 [Anisodus tanguticus]